MKRSRLAAWPVLAAALALSCGPTPESSPGASVAGDGVELHLRALDGRTLDLRSLRGKVVLVDVWATWCGPCLRALPTLARVARARPDELVVVGLSTDHDRRALASFLEANPLPYFVAHADREAHRTFRTNALPTIFVLDREGRVRDKLVGDHPESRLMAVAERYL